MYLYFTMEFMMHLIISIYWLGQDRETEAHKGMHSLYRSYVGDQPSVCMEDRAQCT